MKERTAILLCLLASFIWGTSFVAQSSAANDIGPLCYNGIRMLIGFVVLLPIVIKVLKRHKGDKKYYRALLKGTVTCGSALFLATNLQQFGIMTTTAGKAAFITSFYTLIVPILSVLLKKKIEPRVWGCVAIGLVGAFLLSVNGDTGISKGDLLIFACAFMFAVQIMCIDHFGKELEGIELSAFQFLFCGIIGTILGVATEPLTISMIQNVTINLLYSGFLSCGVAYTLQTVCQKYTRPEKATLALSLENAWGAIAGAVVLHEVLTTKELIGCLLLFAAVMIAQLPAKQHKKN